MTLQGVEFKDEYRSLIDDVVKDFYVPALSAAVRYDRAVGWFSSSALQSLVPGLAGLIRNGGKIRILASPRLSKDDVDAIQKGYSIRDEIVEGALLRALADECDPVYSDRLNILANLIAAGVLDIKIVMTQDQEHSMYHEKMGLIYDASGNVIAFAGSMNESETAIHRNYESFDVFRSWEPADVMRVSAKEEAFSAIWSGQEPGIQTFEFESIKNTIIEKYLTCKLELPHIATQTESLTEHTTSLPPGIPHVPSHVKLHDYQIDAISAWADHNYRGIFDMATGTGKTYTGLGAIVKLHNQLNGKLAVIIACPYQHLVEQWVEDIRVFNIRPIIAYGSSAQHDWKTRLDNAVFDFNLDVEGARFFCLVCTNATFASTYVQSQVARIHGPALFVVDEAHNFGASQLRNVLPMHFKYRLALSATLERHGDAEGTDVLFQYFGDKCIQYTLEKAIDEHKLTPYKYYPVLISLTDEELEAYDKLTTEIGRCVIKGRDGKTKLSPKGEQLVLKRARLTAAAFGKLEALRKHILPYQNSKHILVYCGAASLFEATDEDVYGEGEIRQIDAVTSMLGNQLGMKVSQFTSKEKIDERELLKSEFARGEQLQVLIAIKCLDEGVNIPQISTAFILASTTNPKEYIQRRGRVLRRAPGKEFAEIFDFVILPHALDEAELLSEDELNHNLRLVKNELARVQEFTRLALNFSDGDKVIREIRDAYRLSDEVFTFVSDEQEHNGGIPNEW